MTLNDSVIGHIAPTGDYPAVVIPVVRAAGTRQAVLTRDGHIVLVTPGEEARVVENSPADFRGDVGHRMDRTRQQLFARAAGDLQVYDADNLVPVLRGWVLDAPLLENSPFALLRFAIESRDGSLLNCVVRNCVARLQSTPRFLQDWYQRLRRELEPDLLSHIPDTWEVFASSSRTTQGNLRATGGFVTASFAAGPATLTLSRIEGRARESARPRSVPTHVGRYSVLEQIASGGMGSIWLARDDIVHRVVAMKATAMWDGREDIAVARARRELQIMARVGHITNNPLLDYAEVDGALYLFMPYHDGTTISEMIRGWRNEDVRKWKYSGLHKLRDRSARFDELALSQGPATDAGVDEVIRLMSQMCSMVADVHASGVVHRDLKPSNFLLRHDGLLVLLDFGLAFEVAGESNRIGIVDDQFAGTPAYMAPEHIESRGRVPSEARSDVFALGATLYECLTLKRAFEGNSLESVFDAVMYGRFAPLRTVNPRVPRDIESIVHKALERNPRDRYQHAGDLADDLSLAREGLPIMAYRRSFALRFERRVRRNPTEAALILLSVILMVLSLYLLLKLR